MFYYYNNISFYVGTLAQALKSLPAMWEPEVGSLDPEDPLEKEMATHSSILMGESHGQSNLAGYSPVASQRVGHN